MTKKILCSSRHGKFFQSHDQSFNLNKKSEIAGEFMEDHFDPIGDLSAIRNCGLNLRYQYTKDNRRNSLGAKTTTYRVRWPRSRLCVGLLNP